MAETSNGKATVTFVYQLIAAAAAAAGIVAAIHKGIVEPHLDAKIERARRESGHLEKDEFARWQSAIEARITRIEERSQRNEDRILRR